MKRRSNRDYFGPMTGFKGILHRTAMFLLYPLRKPLIFFPLLILLYLIPTFIGARPSEVHVWYWNKIKSAYNSAAGVVSLASFRRRQRNVSTPTSTRSSMRSWSSTPSPLRVA